MKHASVFAFLGSLLVGVAALAAGSLPGWDSPPALQKQGQFWRYHWYERGLTNGNPSFEWRFRVNSPEVSLHPTFGLRVEARENGMMLIRAEEDLFLIAAAEFYCEAWGGHPGTANKRITINGRSTYPLPRVGAEEGHCTYFYPTVTLKLTDLVNGYDAIQFALDQGTTFWGHMIVDNAAIRVALTNGHPDLDKLGLAGFQASIKAQPVGETIELALSVPVDKLAAIASVAFQGYYRGYDENGDGQTSDWHGFTKMRQPVAFVGAAGSPPFTATWDVSMLPAQKDVAVRAVVHFKDQTNLVYLAPPTRGLEIADREHRRVALYPSKDLPHPFWSRANRPHTCAIDLDADPGAIERAELHVVVWDGGAGQAKDYFTLNGHPLRVAGGGKHDVIYSTLKLDPSLLKKGTNQIVLLSDTEHHGIEVLLPGPALMIRSKR